MGNRQPLRARANGQRSWLPGGNAVEVVPPTAGGPPSARRPKPPRLTPSQYQVLQAVADGRISRGWLLGDLEPYLFDGRDVIGELRRLVLRRLVLLAPAGPPRLTRRGRRVLDGPD